MPRPGRQVKDRLIISDVPAYLLNTAGVVRKVWAIHRYTTHGIKSYTNKVVKLRCERILRKKYTRKSWVDQFVRELAE